MAYSVANLINACVRLGFEYYCDHGQYCGSLAFISSNWNLHQKFNL